MAILYGIHAVLEALKANPERIERVCIERGRKDARVREILDLARLGRIPVSMEETSWLDRRAGGRRHQGVLCYAAEMSIFGVEEILQQAKSPGLLVVLDGIEDPQNVGAILRSAEAAGADGVFMAQRRSSELGAAVVKASAGAASHVKVGRVPNLVRLFDSLKAAGFWVAGLDAAAGRRIWEIDLTEPLALVLGGEGSGLGRLVKEKCDFLASLPIRGNVASYNVSVAAGMALYEVLRQRSSRARQ